MRPLASIIAIGIAGVVFSNAVAQPEYYTLEAGSYHCATAEPLENEDEFLAQYRECAKVEQDWWLIAPPETAEPGVVRIDMGGRFGVRYARAENVVLDVARPDTNTE